MKNVDICIELFLVCIAVVLGVVGGDGEYVNTIVSFILSNAIRLCCDTRGLSWTGAFPHTDTSASHRNISIMPSGSFRPAIITGIMGRYWGPGQLNTPHSLAKHSLSPVSDCAF